MANSVDPDQTGAVCSGSTLFASILISSIMVGNYLEQTTSADVIFQMHFFLGTLRVNSVCWLIFHASDVICCQTFFFKKTLSLEHYHCHTVWFQIRTDCLQM